MRIQRFRMLGIVMGLALLSTSALAILRGETTAFGATTTLSVLSGDVSVKHLDDTAFVGASDGEIVGAGDTVRTGPAARAVVTYFEGSSVTLEPDTVLVIDAAEARGGGTVVSMTQLLGRTWHVVTKLVNRQSRYDVKTPASTASVRGTRFLVEAAASETTITTAEGKVVAAVPSGRDVVEVPVTAGMTQTQERGAPPAPARATPSAITPPSVVDQTRSGAVRANAARDDARRGGTRAFEVARLRAARDAAVRGSERATGERSARVRQPLQPATKTDHVTVTRRDAQGSEKRSRDGATNSDRMTRTADAGRDRERRD